MMNIGIVKELRSDEHRVALTPGGVQALVKDGNVVYVQSGAGAESGFSDDSYRNVGAQVVYSRSEVFGRSMLLLSVSEISSSDYELLVENQIVVSFHHMAVQPKKTIEVLQERKITAIGFEIIEEYDGRLPVQIAMSEIAGPLSVLAACHHLQNEVQGRGMLLGGIPGIPPADVVILGAGVVGRNAVQAAIGLGAQVTVLDNNLRQLQRINQQFGKTVVTSYSNDFNIQKAIAYADVLIGSVLIHGEKTPHLITREMVKKMKPKSVIVDVSIDQGGCIETSRPTTFKSPTFVEEGVIHYCVPNIASNVSRTATYALTNAALPYIRMMANRGIDETLKVSQDVAFGVYFLNGRCANKAIAGIFNNLDCCELRNVPNSIKYKNHELA